MTIGAVVIRTILFLWKRWKDLKLERKFFISYAVLSVIPLCLFGLAAYIIAADTLEKKFTESSEVIANQINHNIDAFLMGFDKLTVYPFSDKNYSELVKRLIQVFPADDIKLGDDMRNYFSSLQMLQHGILCVYVILDNGNVYGYSDISNSLWATNRVGAEDWFIEALKRDGGLTNSGLRRETQLFEQQNVISIARRVKNPVSNQALGTLVFDIDPYMLRFTVGQLRQGEYILADQFDNIIYSSLPVTQAQLNVMLEGEASSNQGLRQIHLNHNGSEWIGVVSNSIYSNWKTVYLLPKTSLYKETKQIVNLALLIIVFLLVIAMAASALVSRSIASPIKRLTILMRKVREGNFKLVADNSQKDEIGILAESFNFMVAKLNELFEQIKQEEKRKRVAEINTLRAQINPHFIYNTLNAIKVMAFMQQADNVAKLLDIVIQLLKYSVSSDRKLVTLAEEIRFIQDYVELLEKRYVKRFSIRYEVEPDLMQARIMPLLLQPIVENAIFHGLDTNPNSGEVIIKAQRAQDGTLILTVADSGKGMNERQLEELMSWKSRGSNELSGTGLKNVHERIELEYGRSYGLFINSESDIGTTITLKMPMVTEGEIA